MLDLFLPSKLCRTPIEWELSCIIRDKKCVSIKREKVVADRSESVTLSLDLSEYSFPNSSEVVFVAFHRFTSVRVDFGTIGDLVKSKKLELTEFQAQHLPKFRLLVVDTSVKPGRLLGSAEDISIPATETGEDSDNIFKVDSRPIKEEIWLVEFDPDAYPRLVINQRIPNLLYRIEHDKELQGIILPAALRTVLNELTRVVGDMDQHEIENGWVSRWLQFCREICGASDVTQIATENEMKSWVDSCVTQFTKKHSFATHLINLAEK